jgi:hypothetical protein
LLEESTATAAGEFPVENVAGVVGVRLPVQEFSV